MTREEGSEQGGLSHCLCVGPIAGAGGVFLAAARSGVRFERALWLLCTEEPGARRRAGQEVQRVSEVKGAQVAQTHKVATGSLRLFLLSGKAQLLRPLCQAVRASGLNAS